MPASCGRCTSSPAIRWTRASCWWNLIGKALRYFVSHPVTRGTRTVTRRVLMTCAVILAAAFVSSVTVDLGPALRAQAETQGSKFLKRNMRIGHLGVWLWGGQFQLDDFVIDGLTPQ